MNGRYNRKDADALQQLREQTGQIEGQHAKEIKLRLGESGESGRTLKWTRICKAGKDTPREMHGTAWEQKIANNEGGSIESPTAKDQPRLG